MPVFNIRRLFTLFLATSILSTQVITPAISQGADIPDIIPPNYPGSAVPLLNPIPLLPTENPDQVPSVLQPVPVFPDTRRIGVSPTPKQGIVDLDSIPRIRQVLPELPPVSNTKVESEIEPPVNDEKQENPYYNPPVESVDLVIEPPELKLEIEQTDEFSMANQLDFLASIGLPRDPDYLEFLRQSCQAIGAPSLEACASNSKNYSKEEQGQLAGAMMTLIWTIAERDPSTWTDKERKLVSYIEERIWQQQIEYAERAGEAWEKFVDDYAKENAGKPGFSKLMSIGPDATAFELPSLYEWTDAQTLSVQKTVEAIELAGGLGGLFAGLGSGLAVGGGLSIGISAALAAQTAFAAGFASTGTLAGASAASTGTAFMTSIGASSGAIGAAAGPAAVVVVAVLILAVASAKVDGAKKMEKELRQAVVDARNTRPDLHAMASSGDEDIGSGLMLALYDMMVARPGYTSPDGKITFINQ